MPIRISNMSLRILTTLALLLAAYTITAQDRTWLAVDDEVLLYLRDGSVLVGTVTDHTPEEVTLRLDGGDRVTILRGHIKKMRRQSDEYTILDGGRWARKQGFSGQVSALLGGSRSSYSADPQPTIGVDAVVGHQLRPWLAVGGGITYYLHGVDYDAVAFPGVQAAVWGRMGERSIMPYYRVQAGYSWFDGTEWQENYRGGLSGKAEVGAYFPTRSRLGWTLSVGYLHQQYVRDESDSPWSPYVDTYRLHRLFGSVGIAF